MMDIGDKKGERMGNIPGPDGNPRPGVFYVSNDMITDIAPNPDPDTQKEYDLFLGNVEAVRREGVPLSSGPVLQPNNLRALCTGDWKLIRYVDPNGVNPDEWELYCVATDPVEKINIVDFKTGNVRDDVKVPGWATAQLGTKNDQLKVELAKQEALLINQAGWLFLKKENQSSLPLILRLSGLHYLVCQVQGDEPGTHSSNSGDA
jgi:hypothetical protein